MFNQQIHVSGSSLALLKVGECGTVLKVSGSEEISSRKLRELGLAPGVPIKITQGSPSLVIKAGNTNLRLDKQQARSIYVRITT